MADDSVGDCVSGSGGAVKGKKEGIGFFMRRFRCSVGENDGIVKAFFV